MKYLVLLFLFSAPVFACQSSIDCDLGEQCVRAYNQISLEGICVQPMQRNGLPDIRIQPITPTPRNVGSCQFDSQCGIGGTCTKGPYELYGVCTL